ncbi:MAG TPA: hypothetical protein VHT05_06115 [Candidatus Elarobacter sp.]|nr:hypothetical protein [Candidatus Elarobacter sp.]
MPALGLDTLRARVHADPALAARLAALDGAELDEAVERLARDAGVEVTRGDLDAAIARARSDWLLRWIR